jgi:peptidyl-prolyl cis-trans isomerase SurA
MIKQMYEAHAKQEVIRKWVEEKIKDTYTKISEGWDNCEFRYSGWTK